MRCPSEKGKATHFESGDQIKSGGVPSSATLTESFFDGSETRSTEVTRLESILLGSSGSLLHEIRRPNFPSGETSRIFSNAGDS